MPIFNNTVGGHYDYDNYGKTVSYTFPDNAYVVLNGVRISLASLKVNAYGGKFDEESIKFFAQMSSVLPEKSYAQYNTNLFVNDNDISGSGLPSRKDFEKNQIPYLSTQDFNALLREVNSNRSHPKAPLLSKVIAFFKSWTADNQKTIKDNIQSVLSKNKHYPKHLSIIYDDGKLKHTTHIILSYDSPNSCTLRIDNTLSPTYQFFPPDMIKQLQVDLPTCKELVSTTKPNFIDLYKGKQDEKPAFGLELREPVNVLMQKTIYARMITMLKEQLGIPINQVSINHTQYNQKNTNECVVFAVQNKIDFFENKPLPSETPLEAGTRLRAEQAILAYFLTKAPRIPHADELACRDGDFNYPEREWYSNYPEVCHYFDQAISKLEFPDLTKLYLAIELDGVLSLSASFKKALLCQMTLKAKEEDYLRVPSRLPAGEAEIQQELMAPQVLYSESTQTLFYSKELKLSTEQQESTETSRMGSGPLLDK